MSPKIEEKIVKKTTAIPLKFDNHRLIPQPVPDTIRPSNEILQGRLSDMAKHISEWSTDIIDSANQNKDWMPVTVTAELLKSRLNIVLQAIDDYHTSLDDKEEPSPIEEAPVPIRQSKQVAPVKKPSHIEIPVEQPSYLDSNFATAVAYQQYYPYYYQPQQPQPAPQTVPQRPAAPQQPYLQPQMPGQSNSRPTTPSDISSQITPVQMQQLYAQQQYAMQQNPMFMMQQFTPEQQFMMNMQQQQIQPQQAVPPPPQYTPSQPEELNPDNDFTKMLFEDMG